MLIQGSVKMPPGQEESFHGVDFTMLHSVTLMLRNQCKWTGLFAPEGSLLSSRIEGGGVCMYFLVLPRSLVLDVLLSDVAKQSVINRKLFSWVMHFVVFLKVICCVDKQGVLSWPNPSPETVLFFSGRVDQATERHDDITDQLSLRSYCQNDMEDEVMLRFSCFFICGSLSFPWRWSLLKFAFLCIFSTASRNGRLISGDY